MARVNDLSAYCGVLAEQLRVNGVREQKVGEIVAQVADHVVATGEDPVQAFGTPVAYARACRQPHWSSWALRLMAACAGAVGVWALIFSLTASDVGWSEDLNIDRLMLETTMPFLTLAIMNWTVWVWLIRRRAVRQSDGHSSARRRDWVVLGLGLLLVSGLMWWGRSSLPSSGPVLSEARWLVAVFGLVTVPGVYFTFPPSQALPARPRSRRIR